MSVNRSLLAVGCLLLAGGAFLAVRNNIVPEVDTVRVTRGVAIRSATGNVTVLPSLDLPVVTSEQGILTKFDFKEGDAVKKGAVIAEIDKGPWPYQLKDNELTLEQLKKVKQNGTAADLQLDRLRKAYAKFKELEHSGNYPKDELEQRKREVDILQLQVDTERAELEYKIAKQENLIADINRQIERRTIRADYDGIIMTPAVMQGSQIFAGNKICNITSLGKILKAEVSQDDLDTVRSAKRVAVKLFSQGDRIFEGTLSQVIPIGNSSTQRFTVFIDAKDLPAEVLSGQTGEATFVADEHKAALIVPRKAVIGTECFVVKDGLVEKRTVKIGYTTLTDAEILSGLNEGERVVVTNVDLLRDKEKVNAVDEKP